MAPTKHATVSASAAHRWMLCPRSVKAEEPYPATTSEAAEEGTVAHALAEYKLTKMLQGKKPSTPKAIKEDPLYKPAMEEHVNTYIDAILETLTELKQTGDPVIYIEQKLDLSEWVPDGFGTADCVIIADGTMHVFDLKYGKGVRVDAEENPQLQLYALGAVKEFELLYDITDVVLHISQPRIDNLSEWPISVEVLKKWGQFIVKPQAQKAYNGEGDFNPGESQCRWCRAKNRCRAYNDWVIKECQLRFDDIDGHVKKPDELSDAEIAALLGKIDEIKRWATEVTDWAKDQAINHGVEFPGYKIVEGRSNRKIVDEMAVITILAEKGYKPSQTCELKGIGALTDLVGEKKLEELIGDHIVKPRGKPTLVPESDKRPVYNDIKFEKE